MCRFWMVSRRNHLSNGRNSRQQFYALWIVGTGEIREIMPDDSISTDTRKQHDGEELLVPLGTKERGKYIQPQDEEVTICISAAKAVPRAARVPHVPLRRSEHASDEERSGEFPPPCILCIIFRIARIIVPAVLQKKKKNVPTTVFPDGVPRESRYISIKFDGKEWRTRAYNASLARSYPPLSDDTWPRAIGRVEIQNEFVEERERARPKLGDPRVENSSECLDIGVYTEVSKWHVPRHDGTFTRSARRVYSALAWDFNAGLGVQIFSCFYSSERFRTSRAYNYGMYKRFDFSLSLSLSSPCGELLYILG